MSPRLTARRARRALRTCALALLLPALSSTPALAQSALWVEQLGSGKIDDVRALAAKPDGEVFLCGETYGDLGSTSAGQSDAWVALVDTTGAPKWIAQIGLPTTETASGLAPDATGGVFLGGDTFGELVGTQVGSADAWLARLDAGGQTLWMRQFGTTSGDFVDSCAPDGSGGTYIAGTTLGSFDGQPVDGSNDLWLARFDADGERLWVRQVGGGRDESSPVLATDGAGGVYLCGVTNGAFDEEPHGGLDVWLARFGGSGDLLWSRLIGTADYDRVDFVAPDGAGGLFVGGETTGDLAATNAGSWDAWFARFDGQGSLLWQRQFGTLHVDAATGGALDGSGGVYVTGHTQGVLGSSSAGLYDPWIARYDGDGAQLWIAQLGSSAQDYAREAAPDGQGGVYASGVTIGLMGSTSFGGTDVWLARYEGSCNPGTTYCTASATSIPGCQASISGAGSPTLSDAGANAISSGAVPGGNIGLLLFGSTGKDSTPYGTLGGMLCVAAPTYRTAPKRSGGVPGQCNGNYAFSLQDLVDTAPVVTSGAVIHAQVWARDPANQDGFLLSDGIEFTVCP